MTEHTPAQKLTAAREQLQALALDPDPVDLPRIIAARDAIAPAYRLIIAPDDGARFKAADPSVTRAEIFQTAAQLLQMVEGQPLPIWGHPLRDSLAAGVGRAHKLLRVIESDAHRRLKAIEETLAAQTPSAAQPLAHTEAFKAAALALDTTAQAVESGEALPLPDLQAAQRLTAAALDWAACGEVYFYPGPIPAPHPDTLRYAAALLGTLAPVPLPDPRQTGRESAPLGSGWAGYTLAAALRALMMLDRLAAQSEGGTA